MCWVGTGSGSGPGPGSSLGVYVGQVGERSLEEKGRGTAWDSWFE